MLQIKKLNLTHKKDLRIILNDFNLVLNDGDNLASAILLLRSLLH